MRLRAIKLRMDTISTETPLSRRTFLSLCALGAVPEVLAACQDSTKSSSSPPKKPSAQATPAAPVEADWATLAQNLHGTLIRPDNPQYPTARQLFDPRFDGIQPAALAYCASPEDVQTCLAFVRRFRLPLAVRSGGHSYAGYSTNTGLVVDITRMNALKIDAGASTASIGAGARLIDVYAALAQQGLVIPAGSCATVGIAGLTLGGGIGVLGRKFGLTCDNLLSAQVVTADGRILTCDESHDPDLFWALRGGGGGNFGVVTSFTFQAHPVSGLSLFYLSWPWSSAATVVDAWQRWAPNAPDELWSNCILEATSDKSASPRILVGGAYVGGVAPLQTLVQQLISRIGVSPTARYVSSYSLLNAMLYEAGCSGKSVAQCHLPTQDTQGQLQRVAYGAKSDYYANILPRQGIDALVEAIMRRQNDPSAGEGGIAFDAYGGAINRVAADATAFVHRTMLFAVQYTANWDASDSASIVAANQSWLTTTWQSQRPYASGEAYQNYIDPDQPDWQHAYYGVNLARLQRIKAAYDPDNLFHFAQSIRPAG